MADYQGWTNRETWSVALWAGNEEWMYRLVQSRKPFTAETAHGLGLLMFGDATPDIPKPGTLARVNWQEIADAWNEE